MAEVAVRIGGPFWDEVGFDRLLEVLAPAVQQRGVRCDFYVHAWDDARWRDEVRLYAERLGARDRVRVWWYRGPAKSLMHAKFVLSDGRRGLLGSANLTSLGLQHHVEIGVPLTASQCRDLEGLFDGLVKVGLLTESDPHSSPPSVAP
jgi:phosphatidylserine/phosphatidylglycerophosphate/cardiolipin synthase-like enzyme